MKLKKSPDSIKKNSTGFKYKKPKLKEKNTNKTRKKDSVYLQFLGKEGV